MKSQKYNKDEIYPDDFNDDDKLEFDVLLEQSKILFPKLAGEDWLIKKGILAYMRKNKLGDTEPPSQEEISDIRNQYTKDTIFYTEPAIEVEEHQE
jgi:hypothetical protein